MRDLLSLLKKADDAFGKDETTFQDQLSKVRNIQTEQDLVQLNGTEKTKRRLDIAYSSYPPINHLERLIGKNNLMDVAYFQRGLEVAKTVCRIVFIRGEEINAIGTGFMVSPNLMMTNNHVIGSKYRAEGFLAEFEYEKDTKGLLQQTALFQMHPEIFFMTNETLDYTLVAVSPIAKNNPAKKLSDYGYNQLKLNSKKIIEGEAVSIIQHPKGLPKMIAIRDNVVVTIEKPYIHYSTDTQKGSSGSLVANDQWEIVALHRSGVAEKNEEGQYLLTKGNGSVYQSKADEPFIHWIANQGVLIDDILKDVATRILKEEEQQVLKDQLLEHYLAEKEGDYKLPKRK